MSSSILSKSTGNDRIEEAESKMLDLPQVDCPLVHHFSPGVYVREITMPAGSLIIGHEHKTRHQNIVLSGRALVSINGVIHNLQAPMIFESEPGVRKVLYIIEEMRFATVHPTDETDLDKLADLLIVKSPSFVHYHEELNRLRETVEQSHEQRR